MTLPTVKPATWHTGPDSQYVDLGDWRYDIAGVLFEARDLEPFDLPLCALDFRHWCETWGEGGMREIVMHMQVVLAADLSHPVVLCPDGALIDGRHRIARALLEGHTTIRAVRFHVEPKSRRRLADS